jgi:hypothetical protein
VSSLIFFDLAEKSVRIEKLSDITSVESFAELPVTIVAYSCLVERYDL